MSSTTMYALRYDEKYRRRGLESTKLTTAFLYGSLQSTVYFRQALAWDLGCEPGDIEIQVVQVTISYTGEG